MTQRARSKRFCTSASSVLKSDFDACTVIHLQFFDTAMIVQGLPAGEIGALEIGLCWLSNYELGLKGGDSFLNASISHEPTAPDMNSATSKLFRYINCSSAGGDYRQNDPEGSLLDPGIPYNRCIERWLASAAAVVLHFVQLLSCGAVHRRPSLVEVKDVG
jgi:hypothetical protein